MSVLKISKENTPTRLFEKDARHIRRQVKELKFTDKRFENNSAAVRYYTHLGIAAERNTAAANSLDTKIIKASQKEVVTDSLLPLKNSIDCLITVMDKFEKKQDDHFGESRKQADATLKKVESLNDLCSQQFDSILQQLLLTGRVGDEALRGKALKEG